MPDQICLKIDSVENGVLSFSTYERLPNSLRIRATDKAGGTSETAVDLSCISSIALDARCDEIVTPSVREPFSYRLSFGVFNGETLIADVATQGTGDSVTATISVSTDTLLNFLLSARIAAGADGRNTYALENVSLASVIAAGSDGVRLPLVNCQDDTSGINCSIPVWMSCVDNGSNSYTFNFMTGTEASSSTDFVLDLVSGSTRVDMKPLLEHIGGKVEMRLSGELAPMTIYDRESQPVFPMVNLQMVMFADTAEDLLNGTNPHPPTDDYVEAGAYVACFTPVRSVASGPAFYQLAFGVYTSSDDQNSVMYLPDFGGDISDPDFTYNSLDTLLAAGASGVPTLGMDTQTSEIIESPYRIRASQVDNCYVFEIVSSAIVPTLCLEPSCDPCIDMSPLLNSVLGSIQGSFSCDSSISDRISFGVYYNGESVGSTLYVDFGGSLTIGRANDSSFYLNANILSRNGEHLLYRSGSSTSDTITFASLSVGSEVTLMPSNTVPSGFPLEIHLIVTAVPIADHQVTFEIQDSREPMPTLTLTSTQKSGDATEQSIDMSCLTDIIGDTSVSGEMLCGGGLRNHGIRYVRLNCYDSNDTLLSYVSATVNSDGTFTATLPAGCDHFTVHYVESGTQTQYYEADIIASELAVGYVACDIRSGGEDM